MKPVSIIFALVLGVVATFAQGPTPEPPKESPVTAINDRGAGAGGPVLESLTPAGGDMTRIPAAAGKRPTASEESTPVNLPKLIKSGGWAMFILGGMSVITIMMVLMNLFTLRRSAILTPHYMNTADVLLRKRDYLGLLAISSRHSEAVARVVQRTLDFVTKNPSASFEVIREIAESEASGQAATLQHRPTYLADVGMLSPMVGLLGTVWGIIRSFGVLGSGQVAQSRDVLLAAGVSEALVATGTGLIVG